MSEEPLRPRILMEDEYLKIRFSADKWACHSSEEAIALKQANQPVWGPLESFKIRYVSAPKLNPMAVCFVPKDGKN
jgi:hypothetical protein